MRLHPKLLTAIAPALIAGCLVSTAALALNPPTDLTVPEPPANSAPPPPSGGSGISAQPLPPPPTGQPLPAPTPAPTLVPGATGAMPAPAPMPAAAQPPAEAPPPSIGADLGANLWLGSDTSRLIPLIPQLPAPVGVPALRDLQLRLLTTAAASPNVPAGSDPLLPLRAERLNAMGFADAALALAQSTARQAAIDPRQQIERALAAGDTEGACGQLDSAQGQTQGPPLPPDPLWFRARIYCQLARKQIDQAEIGLDMMREAPTHDADTQNFLAVAQVAAGDAKPSSIKQPIATGDPVLIALMKLAKLPMPASATVGPPKPVGAAALVATARDPAQPLLTRIDAGERAFALGLIPADELAALYQQAPNPAGDPVAGLAASDSPMTRAALYKATAASQLPEIRARLIAAAMQHAHARGDYFAQAMLYARFAQQVNPARNIAWFAPEAARLMFFSGNVDRGGFWLNIVDTSVANPDLARTAPGLRLLASLAHGHAVYTSGDPVAAWRQATGAGEQQASRVYAIFAGLGQRIGGWNGIAPITQNGSLASQINAAALAGRHGETVLLSLIALGGDRIAAADPASLSSSLGGLTSVGLQAEARAIGIDAAIALGL